MTVNELQPKEVMKYFIELSSIPRGSRNTKAASDYCVEFAKSHNLSYIQDEHNNIIITKEASEGYENVPGIIIQGHLDIVCEKEDDCTIDFEKDGLTLLTDGKWVWADGTTLGADDGIAIAYALALLADDSIKHPKLEMVFTVDEEIGMIGATAMDLSSITGKYLINIDSDEEGVFYTSCAGGVTAYCEIPVSYVEETKTEYEIRITGLKGGHSGAEIDKYRANSNVLMGRLLHAIDQEICFGLTKLMGGAKDNAIPRLAVANIFIDDEDSDTLEAILKEYNDIYKNEYATADPDIRIEFVNNGKKTANMLHPQSKEKVIFMLCNCPGGIIKMSVDIKGLVQTSLNMGILTLDEEKLSCVFAVRSSVKSEKNDLISRLQYISEFLGGEVRLEGDYPAWPFNKESKLRNLLTAKFEEQFGYEPRIAAIHAGMECGIFIDKISGLDCVSFGPALFDIHCPEERMDIESVQRYWEYIKNVLEATKELD